LDIDRAQLIDKLTNMLRKGEPGAWLPEESWYSSLLEHCKGDHALILEVIENARFAREPVSVPEPARFVIPPLDAPYPSIPRYRIVGLLGQGGMGTVYNAIFEGDVFSENRALKLIRNVRPDLDPNLYLSRFKAERALLGSLKHPNIVRIIEDGSIEGLPYFVMELVEGARAIDDFCSSHNLSLDARLRLFRDVCQGVHYAHIRGVLHRDLKPSNLLVSDVGQVKVVDFGLATQLLGNGASPTVVGVSGEYTSPEQREGKELTAASDVYSLGKVLSKLLMDCSDYKGESGLPNQAGIKNEIDQIIFRATRLLPTDRYQSAEMLDSEIQTIQIRLQPSAGSQFIASIWASQKQLTFLWLGVGAIVVGLGLWQILSQERSAERTPAIEKTETANASRDEGPEKTSSPSPTGTPSVSRSRELVSNDPANDPSDGESVKEALPTQLTFLVRNQQAPPASQTTIDRSLGILNPPILEIELMPKTGSFSSIFLDANGSRVLLIDDAVDHVDAFGRHTRSRTAALIDVPSGRVLAEAEDLRARVIEGAIPEGPAYVLHGCEYFHFDVRNGKIEAFIPEAGCYSSGVGMTNGGRPVQWGKDYLSESGRTVRLNPGTDGFCRSQKGVVIVSTSAEYICKSDERYAIANDLNDNAKLAYYLLSDGSRHSFPAKVWYRDQSFNDYRPLTLVDEGKTLVGIRTHMVFLADASTGELLRQGNLTNRSMEDATAPEIRFASRYSEVAVIDAHQKSALFRWPGVPNGELKPMLKDREANDRSVFWDISKDGSRLMELDRSRILRVFRFRTR
jgi:serine/threonine protein kinase